MSRDAWQLADDAAAAAGVSLRQLTSLEDAKSIERVMIATWGEHQLVPHEMIRALAHSGNVPYGAVAGGELIGYVLGWAGIDSDDGLHVHSHMLAAMPDRRHRGVGYALKLAQRAQCLDQGIGLVKWTFDPLIARNAWFNLAKLGATAERFLAGFYGEMSDAINRGDRSDRLVVRWVLDRMTPGPRETGSPELVGVAPDGSDLPITVPLDDVRHGTFLVRIPREYQELRGREPGTGRAWREATARAFSEAFEAGFHVVGFTDDGAYVLERRGAA